MQCKHALSDITIMESYSGYVATAHANQTAWAQPLPHTDDNSPITNQLQSMTMANTNETVYENRSIMDNVVFAFLF